MNDDELAGLLGRSAPRRVGSDPGVRAHLDAFVAESHAQVRITKRRRNRAMWIALPVIAAPVLALALSGNVEPRMVPDFTIPISYTTDTGVRVSCSIDYFNGEIDYVETGFVGVDALRERDWSGIGQDIYQAAVGREVAGGPEMTEQIEPGIPLTQMQTEWRAWVLAENDLIVGSLPNAALAGVGGLGSNTNCTGQLH